MANKLLQYWNKSDNKLLFQNRSFLLLFLGQIVSLIGDEIGRIGLALIVFEQTGSTFAAGGFFAVLSLAFIVMGPLLGFLADYQNRKGVMIVSDLGRAGLIALIPFTTNLWQIYVIGFLIATLAAIFRPTRQAILPEVVGKDLLGLAFSMTNSAVGIIRIIGPLFGTAIIALIGVATTIWVDSFTYLISGFLISIAVLPKLEKKADKTTPYLQSVISGFVFLRSHIVAFMLSLLWPLIIFIVSALPVVLLQVSDDSNQSGVAYGSLLTALGIGVTFGSILGGKKQTLQKRVQNLFWSGLLTSVGFTLLGLPMPDLLLSLLLLAIGLAEGFFLVSGSTIWGTVVPNEVRGRASASFNAIIQVGALLGGVVSGYVIDTLESALASFMILGGTIFLVFILVRQFTFNTKLTLALAQVDPNKQSE